MSSVLSSKPHQIFYLFPPKEELAGMLSNIVRDELPSLVTSSDDSERLNKICKIAANIFGAVSEEKIPSTALTEEEWKERILPGALLKELQDQGITSSEETDSLVIDLKDLIFSQLKLIGKIYAENNPGALEQKKAELRAFNYHVCQVNDYIRKRDDSGLKECIKDMYRRFEGKGRKFAAKNFSLIVKNGLTGSLEAILDEQATNDDSDELNIGENEIFEALTEGFTDRDVQQLLIKKLDSPFNITRLFYLSIKNGSINPVILEEVIKSSLFSWDNIDHERFITCLRESVQEGRWTVLTTRVLFDDSNFISFLKKIETELELEDFIKTIVDPYLERYGTDHIVLEWLEKINKESFAISKCLANQLFSKAINYHLDIPNTLILAAQSADPAVVFQYLLRLAEKANQPETALGTIKKLEMLGKQILERLPRENGAQLFLIRFTIDNLIGPNPDKNAGRLVNWILESGAKKYLDGLIKPKKFWEEFLKRNIEDLPRYLTILRHFPVSDIKLEEFYELSKKHENIPAIKAIFMNLNSEKRKKNLINDFIQWFPENTFIPVDFEEIAPYFFGSQIVSLIDADLLCNFLQSLDPEISKDLLPYIGIEHIKDEKVLKVILDLACDYEDVDYTKKVFYEALYISKITAEDLIEKWKAKDLTEEDLIEKWKAKDLTEGLNQLKDSFYKELKRECSSASGIGYLKTYADKALNKESFFELSEDQLKDIIRNSHPKVFDILLQKCMKHGKINVVKAILDANAINQNLLSWASYCAVFYGKDEYIKSNLFNLKLALSSSDTIRMNGLTYNADELLLKRCMRRGNTDLANDILDANASDEDKYNSLRGLASYFAIFYGQDDYIKSDRFDFKLALSKGSNFPNGRLENAVQVARQNNLLDEAKRRELALFAFENISLSACLAFCSDWEDFEKLDIPLDELEEKVRTIKDKSHLFNSFNGEFLDEYIDLSRKFGTEAIREKLMIELSKKSDDPDFDQDLEYIFARAYLKSFSTLEALVKDISYDANEFDTEKVLGKALKDHLEYMNYHESDINRAILYCVNRITIEGNTNVEDRFHLKVILSSKSIQKRLNHSIVNLIDAEGSVVEKYGETRYASAEFALLCTECCPNDLLRHIGVPPVLTLEKEEEEQYRDNDFSPMPPSLGSNQIIAELERLEQRQKQTNNKRNTNSENASRRPNSNLSFKNSRSRADVQTNSRSGRPSAPAASQTRSSNTSTSERSSHYNSGYVSPEGIFYTSRETYLVAKRIEQERMKGINRRLEELRRQRKEKR